MTTLLPSPLGVTVALSPAQLLSGVAAVLLVFVSVGVLYLSSVEWRDRRRRKAAEKPGRP